MEWLVFVALVFLAGVSGAVFKPGPWYESLKKPSWTPPNGMFPIVWTVLYILIAWAGVLVWRADGGMWALMAWGAQWIFNTAWSWLFFGRQRMDQALIDVCLLWLAIVVFIVTAWPVSQLASLLFLPYLAWVSTAALLNRTVWRLNTA